MVTTYHKKKNTYASIDDLGRCKNMADIYDELQEANTKAYRFEQDAMRAEIRIESLRKRVAELEHELEVLKGELVDTACIECGATFTQRQKGRKKKYCSDRCKQEAYRTRVLFGEVAHAAK